VDVQAVRYVALGDSYTIGTAVDERDRWPNQLVARIPELALVRNPAVNGFASADLVREELPTVGAERAELVTVLIGVNDVVRGVPEADYRANVEHILDRLVDAVGPARVITVATPDYTRTPRGGDYGDPRQRREAIVRFNAILREVSGRREVAHVPDVFEISGRAAEDPMLVASDGLHPSGAQYALWVDAIEPVVRGALTD
jgi:lysophospholipase L1-like esterase